MTVTAAASGSVAFATAGASDVLTPANGDNDLTGGDPLGTTTLNITGPGMVFLSGDGNPTHNVVGTWTVGTGATLCIERGTDAILGNAANDITLNGGTFSLRNNTSAAPTFGNAVTLSGNATMDVRKSQNTSNLTHTMGALTMTGHPAGVDHPTGGPEGRPPASCRAARRQAGERARVASGRRACAARRNRAGRASCRTTSGIATAPVA
jgi:hypothetical protein